jgi:hypothetical protein
MEWGGWFACVDSVGSAGRGAWKTRGWCGGGCYDVLE